MFSSIEWDDLKPDLDDSCSIVGPHRFSNTMATPTQGYEDIAGSLTDVRIINNGMGRELVKSVRGKMKSTTLNEVYISPK